MRVAANLDKSSKIMDLRTNALTQADNFRKAGLGFAGRRGMKGEIGMQQKILYQRSQTAGVQVPGSLQR